MRGALVALIFAGCMVGGGGPGGGGSADPTTDPADNLAITPQTTGCTEDAGIYTPYSASGTFPKGTAAQYPWHGPDGGYPNGNEDFTAYSPGEMVECSDNKDARAYLDVTDGCLQALATNGGAAMRGSVLATTDGYYRAVALGYTGGDADHPLRWTDLSVSYRFYYTKQTGDIGNPGFKAFARYRTEDDLYVASWRTDGVVQIQRKQCGVYTPLIIADSYGAPSPSTWHTIKFDAVGTQLSFYVDGTLAVQTTDDVFKSGTGGMRIDSMNDAAIEQWRIAAP